LQVLLHLSVKDSIKTISSIEYENSLYFSVVSLHSIGKATLEAIVKVRRTNFNKFINSIYLFQKEFGV